MPEEFEISITAPEPPTNGTNVEVRYANGRRTGTFSLAAVGEAVAALQQELHQIEPSQSVLEQQGTVLYQTLFADAIGDAFREALTLAQERGNSVRLRIYAEQPALLAIPWEYLYHPQSGQWLALHPKISLVQGLPLGSRTPQPVADLLRVLVMIAAPTDLEQLDTAQELVNLQNATTTAAIELIPIEPTYAALQAALRQHQPHVFHFVGHGFFPSEEGEQAQGSLVFCREDNGKAEYIGGDRLVPLLAGCESLGLVLLNACEGAMTGNHSPFAGLAQRLLQQGVPAVIAMQAPILDEDAVRFSREFYAALGDGYGVEQAVDEGRMRIHGSAYTWGIPTFYLQAQEPFAIPQLTDAQKADRLWQKSQVAAERNDLVGERQLLEKLLTLSPNHTAGQAAQQTLAEKERAVHLYAAAREYYAGKQWEDARRTLVQVERIRPNYQNTLLLLEEVMNKLPPPSTPIPAAPLDHYALIERAVLSGRLTPFLGSDATIIGQPAQRWGAGLYPPRAMDAAQVLADEVALELSGIGSLP